MSRFEPHFLDEIRSRISITEVVGRHVVWDQKKSQPQRGDMWACCPFHGEKSPSFHADDRKGIYHCFGCGAHGDHFRFLTEKAGLSFPQAVEELARDAGVQMPDDRQFREETPEQRSMREARQEERRRLHEEEQAKAYAAESERRAERTETASGIWKETIPLAGSLADTYLQGRGLPPVAEWPWSPNDVLRFHPSLKYELNHRLGPFPALVSRVQGVFGDGVGIWREYLSVDGNGKAPVEVNKVGLGPTSGGAVRLGGEGPRIGAGEGTITSLSAWFLIGCHKPVWACLSTTGLMNFELPSFVRGLEIFPDGDKARARETADGMFSMSDRPGMAAARSQEASAVPILGRENVSIAPEPGFKQDFNDLYRQMKAQGLL